MSEVEGLKQKIQNYGITGKQIRFALSTFEKTSDWQKLHELEDMEFIDKKHVVAVLDEAVKQIQEKRDKVTDWVKTNLIDRKDFVDDDDFDFDGYALELSNAIQVFINREVLAVLDVKE